MAKEIKELHQKLATMILEGKEDVEKFEEKANKTAGVRVRKNMQEAKNICQKIRLVVNETNKSREKTKPTKAKKSSK